MKKQIDIFIKQVLSDEKMMKDLKESLRFSSMKEIMDEVADGLIKEILEEEIQIITDDTGKKKVVFVKKDWKRSDWRRYWSVKSFQIINSRINDNTYRIKICK